MIREKIFNEYGLHTDFRLRGKEVGRLEALSDGVFSLAIGLLVVSSQVPFTFREVLGFLEDFPAFFLCTMMILRIWKLHYSFFLRYGLRDNYCIRLNGFLLFLILFFIYPLKFLFKFCVKWVYLVVMMNADASEKHVIAYNKLFTQTIEPAQLPVLSVIYGAGLGLIFLCFGLFFGHAYRKKDFLELSSFELSETFDSRNRMLIFSSVSFLSVLIAIVGIMRHLPFYSFWAGMVYIFIPLSQLIYKRLKPKITL